MLSYCDACGYDDHRSGCVHDVQELSILGVKTETASLRRDAARPSRQREERPRDWMDSNAVRRWVGMAIAVHPREKDDSMTKNEVADPLGVRYLLATLMAMVLVLGATAAQAQA